MKLTRNTTFKLRCLCVCVCVCVCVPVSMCMCLCVCVCVCVFVLGYRQSYASFLDITICIIMRQSETIHWTSYTQANVRSLQTYTVHLKIWQYDNMTPESLIIQQTIEIVQIWIKLLKIAIQVEVSDTEGARSHGLKMRNLQSHHSDEREESNHFATSHIFHLRIIHTRSLLQQKLDSLDELQLERTQIDMRTSWPSSLHNWINC